MANPLYQPWISVGEKLGNLVGCLHESISDVSIVSSGGVLTSATKLLIAAVSYGVAKGLKLDANIINGTSLLKETGIEVCDYVFSAQVIDCKLFVLKF